MFSTPFHLALGVSLILLSTLAYAQPPYPPPPGYGPPPGPPPAGPPPMAPPETSGPMTVRVTAASLNVRSGPGTSYPVVGAVAQGSLLGVDYSEGSWYHITVPGSISGWVYSGYTRLSN